MFYDEQKTIETCEEKPYRIFDLIDEGYKDLVDKILLKNIVDINTKDEKGNDILQYLLKKGWYDLVEKHMKKKNWNVNNQNNNGDTFAHTLVTIKYLEVINIIKILLKNTKFIPNIRNKKGETILDKSINNHYIYTTIKILEDERFDNIDLVSVKNLYEHYIKNNNYGSYAKVNNLEIIVDNLLDKELLPKVTKVLKKITSNLEKIIEEVKNNDMNSLEQIIYSSLEEIK